jgi:hypothetical protein
MESSQLGGSTGNAVNVTQRGSTLAIVNGVATVIYGMDEHSDTAALLRAIDECALQQDNILAVFIWVAQRRNYFDCPSNFSVEALVQKLEMLAQPVVGIADGHTSGVGITLLAACDLVVSERSNTLVLNDPLIISADTAHQRGFVSHLADDRSSLLRICEGLCEQISALPKGVWLSMRRNLRQMDYPPGLASATNLSSTPPGLSLEAPPMLGTSPDSFNGYQNTPQAWEQPHMSPMTGGNHGWEPLSVVTNSAGATAVPTPASPTHTGNDTIQYLAPPSVSTAASRPVEKPVEKKEAAETPKSPKKKKEQAPPQGPLTTQMICHIPCRITQQELAKAVDDMGYGGKYDFLYIPTGGRSNIGSSNVGYGFVNFHEADVALQFANQFTGFKFQGISSSKSCAVKPAHIQGLAANMNHFCRLPLARHRRLPFTSDPTRVPWVEPNAKGSEAWSDASTNAAENVPQEEEAQWSPEQRSVSSDWSSNKDAVSEKAQGSKGDALNADFLRFHL